MRFVTSACLPLARMWPGPLVPMRSLSAGRAVLPGSISKPAPPWRPPASGNCLPDAGGRQGGAGFEIEPGKTARPAESERIGTNGPGHIRASGRQAEVTKRIEVRALRGNHWLAIAVKAAAE